VVLSITATVTTIKILRSQWLLQTGPVSQQPWWWHLQSKRPPPERSLLPEREDGEGKEKTTRKKAAVLTQYSPQASAVLWAALPLLLRAVETITFTAAALMAAADD
jgi:hypothetical protein